MQKWKHVPLSHSSVSLLLTGLPVYLEFNNLGKKPGVKEFNKKPGIFNIFSMFSIKILIYYLLKILKTICVKQI